ncbi:MAG: tetratricopeptide repeat-containing sulfotransferase family protein, partial [Vitreimonas sp.]
KERNSKATIAAYERALAISRRDPAAHAALAQEYERLHDLARARTHAEQALAGDPANEIAGLALAQALLREKDFAGAEAAALPVAKRAGGFQANQAIAWGVVGEARDRLDDAAGAFAAFTAANRILREQHGHLLSATHLLYHPAGLARMTQLVGDTDVAAWPAPPASFATPAPVFLVGFPRSGTTLLDQILSSHSRIVCIEEREHFAEALGEVIRDADKLARFGMLSAEEIETARAEYWRRVRAENTLPPDVLLVDKLPLNIVVLPLIKRVFPDAKVIFALRDPRDVILSCCQQRFGMNAAMAQFLELSSAAAYYDAIMTLFDVCRQRLALDLHEVRYEDVVADLESAARALAAFLDLDYEAGMLDFNATALKRDINTPSARQVIQPLYNRSIGRWRRYGEQLEPVLPILTPWVERFGYEP